MSAVPPSRPPVRPSQPADRPRDGWEAAFRAMAENGDDALLDPEVSIPSVWDEEEWEL